MEIPKGREGRYTLNDALADETISLIYRQKSVTPNRPLFIYYAPGATHAPHHVPREWMDRFKGQFDQGWDRYREETYQRQLKLGVIPRDAKLTCPVSSDTMIHNASDSSVTPTPALWRVPSSLSRLCSLSLVMKQDAATTIPFLIKTAPS